MLLSGLSILSLITYFFLNFDLETVLLIPSGAAILVYVIGSASGIRLLRTKRLFPWVSLIISLIMLPFVGVLLVASLVAAGMGFAYSRKSAPATVVLASETSVARN